MPDEALRCKEDGLDIVGYPSYYEMPTQVFPCSWDGPVEDLVERARRVAREWRRDALFWWVTDDSTPGILEALQRAGGTLTEQAEVLAMDIARGTPDLAVPSEVVVHRVDDAQSLRDSEAVAAAAYETTPTPEELLPRVLADERRSWENRAGFRSIAYLGQQPAATGGCTMAGPVARLWGAGALREHRGKGAYRAVLDHRLRLARELGATLALVKGRVATSAPILRRAGFDSYGVERCYKLTV